MVQWRTSREVKTGDGEIYFPITNYQPKIFMTSSIISQTEPPLPPWETLPTMYDLPSENPEEKGLPDDFHFLQPLLLYLTFYFISGQVDLLF